MSGQTSKEMGRYFTRYFCKPQPLRTLEKIRADILALERESEGLLGEIPGSSRSRENH
jgi:type I restriction enzyme M protein